jgi:hypothetical protein
LRPRSKRFGRLLRHPWASSLRIRSCRPSRNDFRRSRLHFLHHALVYEPRPPNQIKTPGYEQAQGDLTGAARTCAELTARGSSIDDVSALLPSFNKQRCKSLRPRADFWLHRRNFQTDHFLNAWPAVTGFLAQLGKDVVSRFVGTTSATPGFRDCAKVLHFHMRDYEGMTEFPENEMTYTAVSIYDSGGRAVSDAVALGTPTPSWIQSLLTSPTSGRAMEMSRCLVCVSSRA